MPAWLRPDLEPSALAGAALVYDLDGVLVDVRATYRRAYLQGLDWHLRRDLGILLQDRTPCTLRAVHLLKRHPGFNDPAEVVAILLRLCLVAHARAPGRPLTRDAIGAETWIAARLSDGGLGSWRESTLDGLSVAQVRRVAEAEQPTLALARCRERYVGSAQVFRIFGVTPAQRVLGLARRDKLLCDPLLPRTGRPVAVYTGRTVAEGRLVMDRLQRFAGMPVPVEAVDSGAHKPDGAPLERLAAHLDVQVVVYIGDLPADRQALLDARRRFPRRQWLLGQVLATAGAERWPEADLASPHVDELVAALGPYRPR